MQLAESPALSRSTSLRSRPHGPRTRTHTDPSQPESSTLWTFSRPPISFAAVSELSATLSSPVPTTPPLVSSPTVASASKPAVLSPPPPLSFDPPPLPTKAIPLSVAQWTFSSQELQELVSRAIRLSACESYIRLLSLNILDEQLPQDSERLETLQKVAQAKYRFHVQRRTMLLQALNSFSSSLNQKSTGNSNKSRNEAKDDASTAAILSNLAAQLSETTTAMDALATDLITITSHQSQISSLLATHWGSALAIALRKLNSSYARRTSELEHAAQRINMLEAEVNEAWTEAERLASEMDDLEEFADGIQTSKTMSNPPPYFPSAPQASTLTIPIDDDFLDDDEGDAVITTAEVVHLPRTLSPVTPLIPFSPPLNANSIRITTTTAVDTTFTPTVRRTNSSDAISTRSTRSVASQRARISAAKARSRRASLASLRLPNSQRGSRTGSSVGHMFEDEELPPLPVMPEGLARMAKAAMLPRSARRRSETDEIVIGPGGLAPSFLSFGSRRESSDDHRMDIEIVPQRKTDDSQPSPSMSLPPIPFVWLHSDIPRHGAARRTPTSNLGNPSTRLPTSSTISSRTSRTAASLFRITSTRTKQTFRTLFRHGSESFLPRGPQGEEVASGSDGSGGRGAGAGGGSPSELQLVPDNAVIEFGVQEAEQSIATGITVPDTATIVPSVPSSRSLASNRHPPPPATSYISSIGSEITSVTLENVAIPHPSPIVGRVQRANSSRLARLKTMTEKYSFSIPMLRSRRVSSTR